MLSSHLLHLSRGSLYEETADWESPLGPAPELTEAQVESRSFYKWDEENLAWVLETPPAPEETEE
jgi:hypothetical protein